VREQPNEVVGSFRAKSIHDSGEVHPVKNRMLKLIPD
jgi:hypothetical protein